MTSPSIINERDYVPFPNQTRNMKEQIIKIIESKAQGKYHLEIDKPDLEVIANEILNLFNVSNCKIEQHRKAWQGKSDEWMYERLALELTQKVEEIHKLLAENEQLRLELNQEDE